MNLQTFIEQSNQATDVKTLFRLLEAVLEHECGYDRVIFSLMSDHKTLGLAEGHGLMRSYPDDWMRHYIDRHYEHVDPVRRFGFRHVGPFIWDQLPLVVDLDARQALCMNECRDAGFNNGAAICLRGVMGEIAGIGSASSVDQGTLSEAEIRYRLSIFNAVAHQFYVAFCALHSRKPVTAEPQVILTPRELEVLQLMAQAKSNGVIADILSLSCGGVKFHAQNILQKFGVSDRISAVLKAMHTGIVAPDDGRFVRALRK